MPQLFLCKPNKSTIGKLKYADNVTLSLKTGTTMSELNFTVPKKIFRGEKQIRYPYFDKLKLKFLIRVQAEWGTDYYVIDAPAYQNENDQWSIHAYALPFQLQGKKVYGFTTTKTVSVTTTTTKTTVSTDNSSDDSDISDTATDTDTSDADTTEDVDTPVNIMTALNTILANCYSWRIGHIDDSLLSKTGSFSIDDTTVLDAINTIATTFNAMVTWNTVNNQVNFYDAESWQGRNRGFVISDKRYLTSLSENLSLDGMVTRLHLKGSDSVDAKTANPTGQDYIEDYSYFIGDYATDENGKVLKHSDWMSDGLCQALLDYKKKIEDNTETFDEYSADLITQESKMTTLQTDMTTLKSSLAEIQDKINDAIKDKNYFYLSKSYDGKGWSYRAPLDDSNKYIVMAKADSPINAVVNKSAYTIEENWKVIEKISDQKALYFTLSSGQVFNNINLIVISIEDDEFTANDNEAALLAEYNIYLKQDEMKAKQAEIETVDDQSMKDQNQITSINSVLSIENNFSQDQMEELDQFVIDDTYSDSNATDAFTLMSNGKIHLATMQMPSDSFSLSLVNFLEIVECQRDWDKLYLNDVVTIKYDDNLKIQANVNELDFDFGGGTINVVISNMKHVTDETNKFADLIAKTKQAADELNRKQSEINSINLTKKRLDSFLSGQISLNSHSLIGGINNSETIDQLGYKSAFDDQNYLRLYKGCIVSTNDGGKTWNAVFTPNGLSAESITGNLMLDDKTKISSSTGSIQLTNQSSQIDGSSLSVINGGLSPSSIDATLVNNATLGAQAKDQIDNLEVGGVNLISRSNAIGSITSLTSSVGHSDYGLKLEYSEPNGFTVPMKYSGWVTVSFVACANMDNTTLYMSLNTKDQSDLSADHSVDVDTKSRIYTWVVNYNDANLLTKENLLKFWHVDHGAEILVQDIQLEDGKIRTGYRE
ncbi:hypothetical protein [Sporolactobacillus shoreicorticis]|uniref:hypothetical protein n=1 Tax=Sporolactobacillus shoreicorticis TaxID=1923877 RepID=UPI00403A5BEE